MGTATGARECSRCLVEASATTASSRVGPVARDADPRARLRPTVSAQLRTQSGEQKYDVAGRSRASARHSCSSGSTARRSVTTVNPAAPVAVGSPRPWTSLLIRSPSASPSGVMNRRMQPGHDGREPVQAGVVDTRSREMRSGSAGIAWA